MAFKSGFKFPPGFAIIPACSPPPSPPAMVSLFNVRPLSGYVVTSLSGLHFNFPDDGRGWASHWLVGRL